jgi:hypothetical protein
LLGSTEPRIFTPPLRELTPETTLGFDCIKFAHDVLGVQLHPWQQWLLIHALELLPDGTPRFRTVILLVARQNGKSLLMEILSLFMMYVLGRPLVIGTAQSLDVAEEVWEEAVELAKADDELAAEIKKVSYTNGKKFMRLWSGERYKVAAASRRGGRGLSGDLILMDELREHQSWASWSAVTKTTMARELAQVWAASNAGDAASIVLRYLRKLAHLALGDPDGLAEEDDIVRSDGEDDGEFEDSIGIFEWSALPGCPLMDREGWRMANPSLGYENGITERAVRSAVRTDPEPVSRTEVLCQWVETTADGPFPDDSWELCGDALSQMAKDSRTTFCIEVSNDRASSFIAASGLRPDGVPQVEVIAEGDGTDWIEDWFTDPDKPERLAVEVAMRFKGAPSASLVDPLTKAKVRLVEWGGSDVVAACGDLYDRVRASIGQGAEGEEPTLRLVHRCQPLLDVAASLAATRPMGDGWVWDPKKSPVNASPLMAATGALWLLSKAPVAAAPGYYGSRR